MPVGLGLDELRRELELPRRRQHPGQLQHRRHVAVLDRALDDLGAGGGRCRALGLEQPRAFGLHAHRIGRLHDGDSADRAVLAFDRPVSSHGHLRVGRGQAQLLPGRVEHRIARLVGERAVRERAEAPGAGQPHSGLGLHGEESVARQREVERVASLLERAGLPLPPRRAILHVGEPRLAARRGPGRLAGQPVAELHPLRPVAGRVRVGEIVRGHLHRALLRDQARDGDGRAVVHGRSDAVGDARRKPRARTKARPAGRSGGVQAVSTGSRPPRAARSAGRRRGRKSSFIRCAHHAGEQGACV